MTSVRLNETSFFVGWKVATLRVNAYDGCSFGGLTYVR